MLIREIELENFLSHQSERLSLPEEGIFLLAGESGSGKSSIVVDAIAYALFGAVATRSRKQEQLVNRDAPAADMSVRVLFQLDGADELIVARGVKGGRSSGAWARAYEPDPEDPTKSVLLAEGAVAVARLLKRKLGGMTWRQFYAAFVARQSEISTLTSKTGSERKKLIQRMLGMRELEKSAELISAGLRRAQAEVDQLEFSLGGRDLDESANQLEGARKALQAAEERVSRTEGELKEKTSKARRLERELAPLREAVKSAERLKTLEAERQLWRERADLNEAAELAAQKLPGLSAKIERGEEDLSELRSSYQSLSDQIKEAEASSESAAELKRALSATPEELRELTAEEFSARMADLRSGSAFDRQRAEDAEERINGLRGSGECYVCERPFESEEERESVLGELSREREEAELAAASADDELESLRAAEPSLRALWKARAAVRESELKADMIDQARVDLADLAERGKREREAIDGLISERARLESASESKWPEAAEKLASIERESDEIGSAGKAEIDQGREDELDGLNSEIERLRGSLPEIISARGRAEDDLGKAELALSGLEHEMESLKSLRARAIAYEKTQSLLRGYQQHLAAEIRPALEEIGSEMLQQISSGKMRAMKISDEAYDVEVEFSSGYRIPASMLSGGEEIRTNLCLRLALTRMVSQRTGVPVGFLVLDEPLPSQDPGHVDRILELLESLKPFYRQQFIISHVGDLRNADAIDHVIELDEAARSGERVKLITA